MRSEIVADVSVSVGLKGKTCSNFHMPVNSICLNFQFSQALIFVNLVLYH